MSTLLVAPVAPHWAEEVWTAKLQRPGCVITAGWPAAAEPDMVLQVPLPSANKRAQHLRPRMRRSLKLSMVANVRLDVLASWGL